MVLFTGMNEVVSFYPKAWIILCNWHPIQFIEFKEDLQRIHGNT